MQKNARNDTKALLCVSTCFQFSNLNRNHYSTVSNSATITDGLSKESSLNFNNFTLSNLCLILVKFI